MNGIELTKSDSDFFTPCPSGEKENFSYQDNFALFQESIKDYIGADREIVDNLEKLGNTDNDTYYYAKERLRLKLERGGKANLFFLITECALFYHLKGLRLHYMKESEEVPNYFWGYERCKEVEPFDQRNGYGDFWARGHLKTTTISEFMTVQDLMNDPTLSFGLMAPNDDLAKEIINHISVYLQNMQWIFPETIPESPLKAKAKRNATNITLIQNGRANARSNVSRIAKSGSTGFHYDYIIYDDLMYAGIKDNPSLIKKTVDQVNSTMFLNSMRFDEGITRKRYIGTRYHKNDVWDILQKDSNMQLYIPRIRYPTDDGTRNGRLLLFKRKQWQEATSNTALGDDEIRAQYFMQPAEGEAAMTLPNFAKMSFKRERMGEILATPYIVVDPAFSASKGSDYTAIVVFGYGADNRRYVYEAQRLRISFMNLYAHLKPLVLKYNPVTVFIESNLTIETEVTANIMRGADFVFDLQALNSKIPKNNRIASFASQLLQRQVIWCSDLRFEYVNEGSSMKSYEQDGYEVFMKEYSKFVVNYRDNSDDLLDALAYMYHIPPEQCFYNPLVNSIRKTPYQKQAEQERQYEYDIYKKSSAGSGAW